ncbi:hypothetical protein [Massilia sp. TS11]|uniref:hypothetical protein n=1 Tax=Massilia sp. TS11 TaxID=2908003 RepID=UPI001EDB3D2E|nr:hypothetical protein [Massilia sp. TS11]MCG2584169.1 hypothetical protein [Massilia sp. TS11]
MATEKTVFDDWLKDNLWRDLLFRAAFWVVIASLGAYYSLAIDAQSANDYLKRQSNSVFRLANIIGTTAIFLGLVAMMFKDLEQLSPKLWGRASTLGKVGGVFRRLAGDMTLWTLGALVSTLFVVGIVGFRSTGSWGGWALFTFLYLLLAAMCFIVAMLNVYVRRAEPLLATKFKNVRCVLTAYVLMILGCPLYLHLAP